MIRKHDPEADAIYSTLRDVPYSGGHDIDDSRRVDFGPDHRPRGIELLNVSRGVRTEGLPGAVQVAELLREHGIPMVEPTARQQQPEPAMGCVSITRRDASCGTRRPSGCDPDWRAEP